MWKSVGGNDVTLNRRKTVTQKDEEKSGICNRELSWIVIQWHPNAYYTTSNRNKLWDYSYYFKGVRVGVRTAEVVILKQLTSLPLHFTPLPFPPFHQLHMNPAKESSGSNKNVPKDYRNYGYGGGYDPTKHSKDALTKALAPPTPGTSSSTTSLHFVFIIISIITY